MDRDLSTITLCYIVYPVIPGIKIRVARLCLRNIWPRISEICTTKESNRHYLTPGKWQWHAWGLVPSEYSCAEGDLPCSVCCLAELESPRMVRASTDRLNHQSHRSSRRIPSRIHVLLPGMRLYPSNHWVVVVGKERRKEGT